MRCHATREMWKLKGMPSMLIFRKLITIKRIISCTNDAVHWIVVCLFRRAEDFHIFSFPRWSEGLRDNAHCSELLAHLWNSHVPELLLLRHVCRMRVGHGAVQGHEHAVTGHKQDSNRVRAAVLFDNDRERQDLSGKKGKSDWAWTTDPHWDYSDHSQFASDALLPALAILRTQVGGDSLQYTVGSVGIWSDYCDHVPYSHLPTTSPREMTSCCCFWYSSRKMTPYFAPIMLIIHSESCQWSRLRSKLIGVFVL